MTIALPPHLEGRSIQETILELERLEYEDDFYQFFKGAWHAFDSSTFVDGAPLEAVAEHLQAVVDGDIKRLIINIPPRMSKSSLTSVAFPAYVWAQRIQSPTSGPGIKFLHASYSSTLSLRDSVKSRRTIESNWYKKYWGDRFQLVGDQNTKSRFQNSCGGERLITSIGAGVTGEGGDVIVIDDPNAANEAFSEATIQTTIDWWDQTMSTRLNNSKTGAYIIIQQRLAEDDLTGHILSKDQGEWTHLMLPMRYEPDRAKLIYPNKIGWFDWREKEGDLLWPDRFGEKELRALERTLGPSATAGQLQQRPEVKGGGVIKRDWWQLWPHDAYPPMDLVVASLDTAYTTKTENDYSALTVWGVFSGAPESGVTQMRDRYGKVIDMQTSKGNASDAVPRAVLMAAWQERLELHDLIEKVLHTCKLIKHIDILLIEDKAAGHSVAQEIRRLYGASDFAVQLQNPGAQDKLARLYSVQHLFAEGLIYAPDRSWADMVITQVGAFPKGKHDDLVDCVSAGLGYLRTTGILIRSQERLAEIEATKLDYKSNQQAGQPLYPA